MKSPDVRLIPPAPARVLPRVGRMPFELVWAAICPPLVALLTVILGSEWWERVVPENSDVNPTHLLMPLMLGGMAVLSAVIYFDRRAVDAFHAHADRIRTTQGISAAITLIYLAVAVTALAGERRDSDAAVMVLFLCLPVLLVSAVFLWHTASMIQGFLRRALLLSGFVIITALVEWLSARGGSRDPEERMLTLHSLLIALAFAIHLSTWSTRALSRH